MTDNVARGNRFQQGITADEFYKGTRRTKGVPATPGGVARDPGNPLTGGVPIPGGQAKYRPQEPVKPACSQLTKKGEPCKARPIKGEGMCVGHLRARD